MIVDKPERTDEQLLLDGATSIDARVSRKLNATIRRYVEATDPALYRTLAKEHPLLYGPDSLQRIKAEFPELFGGPTSKP